ncbi:MAG: tandem-95 repeat protein [Pirellulales bacterium]
MTDWQIGDPAGGPGPFHGFSTTSRVGVTNLQAFAVPAKGSYATVVYHANDTVGTTKGPAIYTSRINIFNDGFGNPNSIGVEAPIQVAKIGQNVPGLTGTIQDVALYDPINNDGQIAFWASTATGQAIVQAEPKPITTRVTRHPDRPGDPIQVFDKPHFDPDSPLVEYVVEGVNNGARAVSVNQIIIHATDGFQRGDLDNLATKHSVHYYVTREGRVTQLIRESDIATHAGTPAPNANNSSIGIELEDGHSHRTNPDWATSIQIKKAALLVRDIARRHGILGQGTTAGQIPHLVASTDLAFVAAAFELEVPAATGTNKDIDTTHRGVLAHGQVFRRSAGKDDPANFPSGAASPVTNPLNDSTRIATYHWTGFMTQVNNGIAFILNSPANLLVTAPQGRRVGVVPGTGQSVNEIPGASFTGPGTEPQSLAIPGGIDGQYQVQIVGTAAGMYHLDLYAASHAGDLMRTQVADQTSAGAITNYTLNYTTQVDARATVTAATNLPPVAFDDQLITRGTAPVQIEVLTNDSDPEGQLDVVTVAITEPPDSGVTSVDPGSGIISYTPNPAFVGDDSFQYEVRDTAGLASGIATVLVQVLRETVPPVAAEDERTTPFDTPIVIDVLANDSDPDGTLDPTSVGLAHDGEPLNGSIDIDRLTGQITFTPSPDFVGIGTFEYEVRDNDSASSNAASVTITVLPPDGPEIAVTGGGAAIVDGDATPAVGDDTDFGVAGQNVSGPVRTFTVRNIGPLALTLGPVSVPTGFALIEPLSASLDPGGSDTFSVQLMTSALGTFGGVLTFSTNDANENPFDFTIAGEVATVVAQRLPGSLDLTFGGGDGWLTSHAGSARSVFVLPDGKILAGGADGQFFALSRYLPNGTVDLTFGGGDGFVSTEFSSGEARTALLLPDGKVLLVGGFVTRFGFQNGIGVARYNADGAPDNTFGDFGVVTRFHGLIESIEDAVLQPDGKIVIVGSHSSRGNRDFALARLNANGTVDTTFGGGDGLATTDFGANDNDPARGVVLQPDGKIVVVGQANGRDFGVARFNADGTLDASFGGGDGLVVIDAGGGADVANDVLIQPDGQIVVVGGGRLSDGQTSRAIAIARYNTDGSPDTAFGGGDGIVATNFPGGDSDEARAVVLQPDRKLVVVGTMTSGQLLARYNADGTLDTDFGSGGRNVTPVLGPNVTGTAVALAPDGKIVIAGGGGYSSVGGFALVRYHGDAPALPTITVSATDAEGSETGANDLRFTVTRSGATDQPLTIQFQLQNDGAAG